jgi:hypothetical protein
VRRGKTPVLTEEQARRLLERIDSATLVGATHYYSGAKPVGAMYEKSGKRHEMPAHLKLEAFIDEYLAAAGIRDDGRGPLLFGDQQGRRACGEAYEQRSTPTAGSAGAPPRPDSG